MSYFCLALVKSDVIPRNDMLLLFTFLLIKNMKLLPKQMHDVIKN